MAFYFYDILNLEIILLSFVAQYSGMRLVLNGMRSFKLNCERHSRGRNTIYFSVFQPF